MRLSGQHTREANTPLSRHLDDAELDSGDDEDRDDRIGDGEEQEAEMMVTREKQIQETDLPRLPVPEPSDGEVSSEYFSVGLSIFKRLTGSSSICSKCRSFCP